MSSAYYTYPGKNVGQEQSSPQDQPIEVTPVEVASAPPVTPQTHKPSQQPTGSSPTPATAYIIDEASTASTSTSKLGSAASLVAGGAIALVGVPMLVLPGPGLLAIGGGLALMARGAKGLFGGTKN